jgi:hypothetical protein
MQKWKNEISPEKMGYDDFDRKVEKFFLEHSYEERDGAYHTRYSFDNDYTCTMTVEQYNEDYDDDCDEDDLDNDEYIMDYEVKIICENTFELVATISYSTRLKEWGGLEIQELQNKEAVNEWMDSNPQIIRWASWY